MEKGLHIAKKYIKEEKIVSYTKMTSACIYLPKSWEGHKVMVIKLSSKPVIEHPSSVSPSAQKVEVKPQ